MVIKLIVFLFFQPHPTANCANCLSHSQQWSEYFNTICDQYDEVSSQRKEDQVKIHGLKSALKSCHIEINALKSALETCHIEINALESALKKYTCKYTNEFLLHLNAHVTYRFLRNCSG